MNIQSPASGDATIVHRLLASIANVHEIHWIGGYRVFVLWGQFSHTVTPQQMLEGGLRVDGSSYNTEDEPPSSLVTRLRRQSGCEPCAMCG